MRIIVRGISLENLQLWKQKFSFTNYTDLYFSPDKSFLFITLDAGKEFIETFDGIKWKGDVLRVCESIYPRYTPPTPHSRPVSDPPVDPPVSDLTENRPLVSDLTGNDLTGNDLRGKIKRDFLKIRNSKNRKIIKVSTQNSKFKKRFRDFPLQVSVRNLTWNLTSQSSESESGSESESESGSESLEERLEEVDLKGLFTETTDFNFTFSHDSQEQASIEEQDSKEEIIKSFTGNSLKFFTFDKQVFKRDQVQELDAEKRRELTMIFKKRHKDASRRKSRYY